MLKICFSYGTFETSTNFPNHGVVNICLDLIGQKAKFFLTLLDKCSSKSLYNEIESGVLKHMFWVKYVSFTPF